MKIKPFILAGVAALAAPVVAPTIAPSFTPSVAHAGPGADVAKQPKVLGDLDRDELMHRHHINVMEIEMGKLAKARGTAPVKKYGAMLIADHTKADKSVRALAKARDLKLEDHPTSDPEAIADHEKMMTLMEELKTLKGADFDRRYLEAMVVGHTKELSRVAAAAPQVTDTEVKALLDKTMPTLQKHADGAKALQAPPKAATK